MERERARQGWRKVETRETDEALGRCDDGWGRNSLGIVESMVQTFAWRWHTGFLHRGKCFLTNMTNRSSLESACIYPFPSDTLCVRFLDNYLMTL